MSNWYQWELELMAKLKEQDPKFAEMLERHRGLEARLEELKSKGYLSAEEEALEQRLKREKLMVRDRIEEVLRNYKKVVLPA